MSNGYDQRPSGGCDAIFKSMLALFCLIVFGGGTYFHISDGNEGMAVVTGAITACALVGLAYSLRARA